ncbi:fish-egg lectin-like [Pelodiscus sinensis]|uniref:fish-egg lectin-like n=1 Tax=Pelodiscus sinensis TaxID=13735 RepID=UPI003F6D33B2
MMLWDPLLLLLLLPLLAGSSALDCTEIPGSLRQIDASNGQVFGVNSAGSIYTLHGDSWAQVPGALTHVTVGPAGVWGVNKNNNVFKMVGGSWQAINGLLKQIDAGGDMFISGANMNDDIYCLSRPATVSVNSDATIPWVNIAGKLKYYSCGLWGCWGVNSADDIFFRTNVTPDPCAGSSWQNVPGKLSMIEVGTEGSVYGVNSAGEIYRRDGVTQSNPVGTGWTQLASYLCKGKHVSYDLGLLWIITDQDKIVKCRV